VARRVCITDTDQPDLATRVAHEVFAGLGVRVDLLQTRDPAELAARASDADGLLVQYARITPGLMETLPRLRVIGRYGVGYDNVDVTAATARSIYVCNCPDYCTEEVADHTLALLLATTRGVLPFSHHVAGGGWSIDPAQPVPRLRGRVLGIVGIGRIGGAVAVRARAVGLTLIGADPYVSDERFGALGVERTDLPDLLARADYVTLHVPLTDETHHLMSRETLAMIRSGAVLINTARGGVVDTAALVEALRAGRLGAAALDVLEQEPPPADHPLRTLPNVILTPHAAFYSEESLIEVHERVTQDVARVLAGEAPQNAVNRDARSPR
jgi:D-3-phosphoglycerate dehydrogenase